MKGTILKYDNRAEKGVIRGSDENRYEFGKAEWGGNTLPVPGAEVDFIGQEGTAKEIYPLVQARDMIVTEKSKPTAILLALFLGGFGAHKFYMGHWGWGIIYIATCWLWIPFIVALLEAVRYIFLTDEQFAEKSREVQTKGAFGFLW